MRITTIVKSVDENDIVIVECSNILNSEGFIKGKKNVSFTAKMSAFLLKGAKIKLLKLFCFSGKIFYKFVYIMPRHD